VAKNLVIVESPAKTKTISKFLGGDYKVLASMGHIRDLPKSKTGVDVENDFKPEYVISTDKKKTVKMLKNEVKDGTVLWIATDEDREGEAIGWHLLSALKVDPKKNPIKRIVFHEITKGAITKAIETPREIDQNLVDAQQTRRILDRLVGYELSPLLWRKVRKGLSAGRVQSVAVRLVVEKEREIRAFKPEEFWKIKGEFSKEEADEFGRQKFTAVLEKSPDKKKLGDEKTTKEIFDKLKDASYKVGSVEEKQLKRNPAAPFTTSTLQQEASRKLGFSVKKTMMVAQKLYEGFDVGKGVHGLITYMRTDSVNLSDQALSQAQEVVSEKYGKEFALDEPRKYKGKKGAQDAHEAIRPVDLSILPSDVEGSVEKDFARLYELIWKRTLASQMKQAILNQVKVQVLPMSDADVDLEGLIFHAKGQSIEFPGFMKVYLEGKDDSAEDDEAASDKDEKLLPVLAVEEALDCAGIEPSQHFTKPPARYTEASLVKKLESEGIGRPSTYAPTISTVQQRGYIEKDGKHLIPTEIAEIVTDVLVEHFSDVVDYKFTAHMEEQLDDIADGKKEWVPVMKEFYGPFHSNLEEKMESIKKSDIVNEETDEVCEKCGAPMSIRLGRFGKFMSCSKYPECKFAKPLEGGSGEKTEDDKKKDEELEKLQAEHAGKKCEKCGADMTVRRGRFGPFLGCSAYPKCKTIIGLDGKNNETDVKCPACDKNNLVEKRTRRGGKVFWGCGGYPKCKFASWDKPLRNEERDGKKGVVTEKKGEEVFVVPEEEAK
jgi:DNA topoisomerase I